MSAKPIFAVAINVDAEQETAWNDWYNSVHVPEVMGASKAISRGVRYQLTGGNFAYKYLAVYDFDDQAGVEGFRSAPDLGRMVKEYDERWGDVSQRQSGFFVPILERRRDQ